MITNKMLRNDYIEFLNQHQWNVAVTLTHPNSHNVTEEQSRKHIRHFLNYCDRKFLGWRNEKNDKRLKRFMIMGKGYSGENTHWHGAFQIPDRFDFDDFHSRISNIWYSLPYSGTMVTKKIENQLGWIRYCLGHLDEFGDNAEIRNFHF